jgi:hypothetical protein
MIACIPKRTIAFPHTSICSCWVLMYVPFVIESLCISQVRTTIATQEKTKETYRIALTMADVDFHHGTGKYSGADFILSLHTFKYQYTMSF